LKIFFTFIRNPIEALPRFKGLAPGLSPSVKPSNLGKKGYLKSFVMGLGL
jgi:hypothetical protein